MSESNYLIAGLIVIASLVFVIWLVRRNLQNKKSYEHDVINSELKPEEDNDHDEIRQISSINSATSVISLEQGLRFDYQGRW